MTKKQKLEQFRIELLDNLLNIVNTTHDTAQAIYANEVKYLQQILFNSDELEKLLGVKKNEH